MEAPREFESPHLRHSESPGARQRAGALAVAGALVAAAPETSQRLAGPVNRPYGRGAFASGRSGCLCVFRCRSGIA